jgi:hypothetical protein
MNYGITRKTRLGNMPKPGDVILASVQFTTPMKSRPDQQ